LSVYRIVPVSVCLRIDGDLFDAWTHLPCSLDSPAPETIRHRLAPSLEQFPGLPSAS